ncbi:hypothetical protein [Amycolatopsis orientalis]|uniref:hypothetical protein n=1 Tax=Amycolatopsis orientalis TaxID=31958 RepID=UPI0004123E4C|nr:hypothetical protein [Amycolatopsis orientalis]
MTTTNLDHDDNGDREHREFSTGLTALEKHLADIAARSAVTPPPTPPEPSTPDGPQDSGPATPAVAGPFRRRPGWTRRVRRRVAEHDEAHRLLRLEADSAPFEVTSDKVRTRRKAVKEAAALAELDRDPQVLAYRDARMLRLIIQMAMVSLVLALAWSTAGVQDFAAEGAPVWSPRWVFAWLAEPFCSLALLMVVGARAYLITRGHRLEDPSLDRAEWVFLGLTLGMNAWPHLPGVTDVFTMSGLVLHLLGPIVATAVVRALPRLVAAFRQLALDLVPDSPAVAPSGLEGGGSPDEAAATDATPAAPNTETKPAESATTRPSPARRTTPVKRSARATIPEPKRRGITELRAEFEAALQSRPDGFDPANGASIMRTLKCAKKYATQLKSEYLNRPSGGDA